MKPSAFKPGDRVECVFDCPGTELVAGYYTVREHKDGFVWLEQIKGGWLAWRFKKIGQTFFVLEEMN